MLDTSNPAMGVRTKIIMEFPAEARTLDGLCALSNDVLISADSFASCIWRIDLCFDQSSGPPASAKASKWYSHYTMNAELKLPDFQPGTNGLKYSKKMSCVYYTSTQTKVFCRTHVDADTLEPEVDAEIIAKGWQFDDLIIDDRDRKDAKPMAYVTTHRDNFIIRVPHDLPDLTTTRKETEVLVQGGKDLVNCLGLTAGAWEQGLTGKRALFTSDGGCKNPLKDGLVRCAKVIRVDIGD